MPSPSFLSFDMPEFEVAMLRNEDQGSIIVTATTSGPMSNSLFTRVRKEKEGTFAPGSASSPTLDPKPPKPLPPLHPRISGEPIIRRRTRSLGESMSTSFNRFIPAESD